MAIALVGALLLVVQWAHGRMLWLDEEMIAINIRDRSFGALAGRLSLGQAAPYGWLAIQRVILLTAGSSERALRCLPMAFGIATLATATWIGRRWMSVWGAAALTFLCAFGQWLSFHALELKHYSADACFGLLLPALAVRATESDSSDFNRRITTWWLVAAASQWIANGALFVAPASAAVLMVVATRRYGVRSAIRAMRPAAIWLVSFAANYAVALGPARTSEFLQSYWAPAFPPADAGFVATLNWLGAQFAPLAVKPGGTGFVVAFWTAAAVGFTVGRTRSSRAVFAWTFSLVPVAAFAWVGLRLVPMSERLTLWITPPLYVGIALAVDVAAAGLVAGISQRRVIRAAVAALALTALAVFFADVYARGMTYVSLASQTANHEVDDRGAVTWLARQQQPGDVWVTTRNALPAIWWYADPARATVMEASFTADSAACRTNDVAAQLTSRRGRRLLVYFGFGHDASPEFDDALLATLSDHGHVIGYRRFGETGHALVVEVGEASTRAVTLAALAGSPRGRPLTRLEGCVVLEAANQW